MKCVICGDPARVWLPRRTINDEYPHGRWYCDRHAFEAESAGMK